MPNHFERYLASLPTIAAQRGAPWGVSTWRVFGRGPQVGTTFADVWEGDDDLAHMAVASALEILSDSTDDTAAGVGARTVRITGLDGAYSPLEEEVTLSGTSPVASAAAFLRVNRVEVVTAGTTGHAVGTLTIREAGSGPVQSLILPGPHNVSLSSHYTVPANKTAYILGAKYSSDDLSTRFNLVARQPGETFRARDTFQVGLSPIDPLCFVPIAIPEKTDVKIVANRITSETALALVSYDLIVAPKTLAAIRSFGQPAV